MTTSELIAKLQEIEKLAGNIPVEISLQSYTQVYPTVYIRRINTERIVVAYDNVARIELSTGEDVRISILNKKVVAHV